ncbi:MAG: cytochrome b/b6 domain-containing protein [Bauldia sp.]
MIDRSAGGRAAPILAIGATILGLAAAAATFYRAYATPSGLFDPFAFFSVGVVGRLILTGLLYAVAALAAAGAFMVWRQPRPAANLLSLSAGFDLVLGIVFGQEAVWLTVGAIAATALAGILADASGLAAMGGQAVRRHSVLLRVTHWINAVAIFFLLVSGLQIFNAHPELYVGNAADFERPVLSLGARASPAGPMGTTTILGTEFGTTGILGLSSNIFGGPAPRGFPYWLTLPSVQDLATGRRWHFFFAWVLAINGLVYLVHGLATRRLPGALLPTLGQLRHVGRSVVDHLRGRFHDGDPRRYNVLQKLAYLGFILVLLVLILAGLAMSPGMNALFPAIIDIFGGRQSARTVHFACAGLIVLFILVHVGMVLISGVWNNLRSMITGRFVLPSESPHASTAPAE